MWTGWSPWAANQLLQSHTAVSRIDILRNSRRIYTLDTIDGDVVAEDHRPILRNLAASLIDPSGNYDEDGIIDFLSPSDLELAPYRGVADISRGIYEYAPLGIFRITDADVDSDGTVRVTGQDRATIYQGAMSDALAINGNTPVEQAIMILLARRNPQLTLYSWQTNFTCGPLLYAADINVWDQALELARAAGGWLWHDRYGRLIFGPSAPASTRPVTRYAYGDGRLIKATPGGDVTDVHNIIIALSTNTATGSPIVAVVKDTDPNSPTNIYGSLGERPKTVPNQHISSVEQGQQVATDELVRELGKSQTIEVETIVDPARDPGDVVLVHDPEVGLIERAATAKGVRIPLGVTSSMNTTMNRSILTRDGRILNVPEDDTP